MSLECELKYIDPDAGALRKALAAAGAEQTAAPYFEENLVFDYPDRSLKAEGVLLRLRRKGGRDAVVTVKRPSVHDAESRLKVLEENETSAPDFDATRMVLETLGYSVAFQYEKVREKWRLGNVVACLDRMPFGFFVELEGPEQEVLDAARSLGLENTPTTKATYHELNRDHQRDNNLPENESFVFSPEVRRELLDQLKS